MKKRSTGFSIPRGQHGRLVEHRGRTFAVLPEISLSVRFSPGPCALSSFCTQSSYVPRGAFGGLAYYACLSCDGRGVIRSPGSTTPVDRLWLSWKVRRPQVPRLAQRPSRPAIVDPVEEARRRGITSEKRSKGGIILPR